MRTVSLVTLVAAVIFSGFISPSFAQQAETGPAAVKTALRPLEMDAKQKKAFFSGRTFWSQSALAQRYYFDPSGEYTQQFLADKAPYLAGDIVTGGWKILEDGRLCLAQDYVEPVCYSAAISENPFSQFIYYNHMIFLTSPDKDGAQNIVWNQWMEGRMILAPSYAQTFMERLRAMGKVAAELAQKKSDGTLTQDIWAETAPGKHGRAYYDAIVGKVMKYPMHVFYHREDGTFDVYPLKIIEAYQHNPPHQDDYKEMQSGRWKIFGDTHCWLFDTPSETVFCHEVYQDASLDSPVEGFVSHEQIGFTLVTSYDQFTPIGQSPYKDFFDK